jgi:hypothetical protein
MYLLVLVSNVRISFYKFNANSNCPLVIILDVTILKRFNNSWFDLPIPMSNNLTVKLVSLTLKFFWKFFNSVLYKSLKQSWARFVQNTKNVYLLKYKTYTVEVAKLYHTKCDQSL